MFRGLEAPIRTPQKPKNALLSSQPLQKYPVDQMFWKVGPAHETEQGRFSS